MTYNYETYTEGMAPNLNSEALGKLNNLAERRHCYDGGWYCPPDTGSYDQAWEDGDEHGRTELARELLTLLGQPEPWLQYKKEKLGLA